MEDFIDFEWLDAISIGFNEIIAKNAKKIVERCEKTVHYYGHQWVADVELVTSNLLSSEFFNAAWPI